MRVDSKNKLSAHPAEIHLQQNIQAYLSLLYFALLYVLHRCRSFYKLKARPFKKIMTRFIAMLILLWLSGTKPAVSPRYAYTQMLIRAFFFHLNQV